MTTLIALTLGGRTLVFGNVASLPPKTVDRHMTPESPNIMLLDLFQEKPLPRQIHSQPNTKPSQPISIMMGLFGPHSITSKLIPNPNLPP